MKHTFYFGIIFVFFANSCSSTSHQPIFKNVAKELPKQTPKIIFGGHDETPASFPGGSDAMQNFIYSNLRYPQTDSLAGKQGSVWVQFTVSSTGKLSDFEIRRSLTPDCDAEALRIVKSMPNWTPGFQYGKPVDIIYLLPIRFGTQPQEK